MLILLSTLWVLNKLHNEVQNTICIFGWSPVFKGLHWLPSHLSYSSHVARCVLITIFSYHSLDLCYLLAFTLSSATKSLLEWVVSVPERINHVSISLTSSTWLPLGLKENIIALRSTEYSHWMFKYFKGSIKACAFKEVSKNSAWYAWWKIMFHLEDLTVLHLTDHAVY